VSAGLPASFREDVCPELAVERIYWQSRGGKGKPPKIPGDELIDEEAKVQ